MADEHDIRSRAVLADIYRRHGMLRDWETIDEAVKRLPVADAIAAMQLNASLRNDASKYVPMIEAYASGQPVSGWANPEERADARLAYAREGKTDREREDRWGQSAYLLDPATHDFMKAYGRDIDFIRAMAEAESEFPEGDAQDPYDVRDAAAKNAALRRAVKVNALKYWDRSANGSPLSQNDWTAPNYQSASTPLSVMANVTQNPDVPTGNYMNFSEVVPDRVRMSGSAGSGDEAWEAASGKRLALNRYRLQGPHPILDLPSGATPEQRAARIKELQSLTQDAAVPDASSRWSRWTEDTFGKAFVPPGWMVDSLDAAASSLDPSVLIPLGGAAARGATVAAKGAKVAGSGWTKPLLSNLAKQTTVEAGKDQLTEQGINHGIVASIGGIPSRTWGQWAFGNYDSDALSAKNSAAREDDIKAASARSALYDSIKNDDGVSRADSEAYKNLGVRVHVPYPYR